MLVLRRGVGETVEVSISGQVVCVIEIVEIRDSLVVVGFEADKNVKIMRPEAKVKEPK